MRYPVLAAIAATMAVPAGAQILDGRAATGAAVGPGVAAAVGTPSIVGRPTLPVGGAGPQDVVRVTAGARVAATAGSRCTDGTAGWAPHRDADGRYHCEARVR